MDLTDFKPKSDTVEVILYNPSTEEPLTHDDGTEFSITVAAPHTKEFKDSQQLNMDMWLNLNQKSKKKKNPTLAQMEKATSEHLARITLSWDFKYDKDTPKLSLKRAEEIYTEMPWIRDQIQEAIDDSVDFTIA